MSVIIDPERNTAEVIEEDQKVYVVKEIYLASFFHVMGYKLLRTTPNGFQNSFHFDNSDGKLGELRMDYFRDTEYNISPHKLFEAFKTMRSITA